jgi:Eukaryotic protein of unknown function (DUF829)
VLALDSCPGGEAWRTGLRALHAATAVIAWWPLRWLARLAAPLVLLALWVRARFARSPGFIQALRRGLNDARLFPPPGRRVYLYSTADDMVGWRDVVAHAVEAKGLGYRVEMVEFAGSKHVGHVMVDPKRYWAAIERLME